MSRTLEYMALVSIVAARLGVGGSAAAAPAGSIDPAVEAAASTRPALAEAGPATTQPASVATAERRQADLTIVGQFIEHLQKSDAVGAAARAAILQMWQERRPEEDPQAIMTAAVAIMSEPYRLAAEAVDGGRSAEAVKLLEPLLTAPDFHLSAHAAVLAARALVEDDRVEEARKVLEGIASKRDEVAARTLLGPETLFLLGYCQLAGLEYETAEETLKDFERRFPEAPDQYRLPVRQMLQELAARQPEGLGDVSDLMGYAGRHLKHARTDRPVQTRQERAVELLAKLIEDAEQREQQQQQQAGKCKDCGGKGCPKCRNSGQPQGNQESRRAAERSVLPGGQGRIGDLHPSARARPGEEWGKMRPEERERVLQALRQSFPSRYRQLVEQYYRQLAKEE